MPEPDVRQAAAPVNYPTAYSEEAVEKLMLAAHTAGEKEIATLRSLCELLQTRLTNSEVKVRELQNEVAALRPSFSI